MQVCYLLRIQQYPVNTTYNKCLATKKYDANKENELMYNFINGMNGRVRSPFAEILAL